MSVTHILKLCLSISVLFQVSAIDFLGYFGTTMMTHAEDTNYQFAYTAQNYDEFIFFGFKLLHRQHAAMLKLSITTQCPITTNSPWTHRQAHCS